MDDDATNDTINGLASDIREADGNHDLGASALAEKLVGRGWSKPGPKDDASLDYPRLDSDLIVLGPEIFTGGPGNEDNRVISWKGQNYIIQGEKNPQPPLKSYAVGERVTVMKNGDWLDGQITSIDKVSSHLHVHTERGPVTIGAPHMIHKLEQS